MKNNLVVSCLLALVFALAGTCSPLLAEIKPPEQPELYEKTKSFLDLLANQDEKESKDLLMGRLKKSERQGEFDFNSHYMLALIEYYDYDLNAAMRWLDKVEKHYSASSSISERQWMNLYWRKGKVLYKSRKFDKAYKYFNKAIEKVVDEKGDRATVIELLESMVGALHHQKKYDQAEEYCRKLIVLSCDAGSDGNPLYASTYLWSWIQMASLLDEAGKSAQADKATGQSLSVLDSFIELRNSYEKKGEWPPSGKFLEEQLRNYFLGFNPKDYVDYLWLAVDFEPKSLPVVGWKSDTPKAAIICIHGWGLENRAFTPFGQYMAKEGYAVYALDARGYGSWQAVKGQEDTVYSDTIKDIDLMRGLVSKKYPGIPVFVLGESMGGAVALRAAAQFDGKFAGVIASVPSARRYGNGKMSLKTVANALKGGLNKPFDVGSSVGGQATSRQDLLKLWFKDPKGRTKMSPKDLAQFDLFMRTTIRQCKKIKTTPAIVVQGLADRLVKPKGTFNLYKAISNNDKVLIVDGDAEHLIFESDSDNSVLLAGLSAWIKKRSNKSN